MKFFAAVAISLLVFVSSASALKGSKTEDHEEQRVLKRKRNKGLPTGIFTGAPKSAGKKVNRLKGIKGVPKGAPKGGGMGTGLDVYTSFLSPAIEIPFCTAANPALGNALVTYDDFTNQLCANLTYSGLTGPELFSHIHGPAPIGATADVLFTLSTGQIKTDCFQLTNVQEAYLESGLLYFNVHTQACQPGEIRGQILPAYRY